MADQTGTYGTRGMPDAANVPGARDGSISWTDESGNLWLFGGELQDSEGNGAIGSTTCGAMTLPPASGRG